MFKPPKISKKRTLLKFLILESVAFELKIEDEMEALIEFDSNINAEVG